MRLIDADALLERMTKAMESGSNLNGTFHLHIEHAPTIPRPTGEWIPVSEILPISPTFCLVTTDGSHGDVIDIALYMSDGWHKASEVIAWMPLPEPYREDGEA